MKLVRAGMPRMDIAGEITNSMTTQNATTLTRLDGLPPGLSFGA